MLVYLAKGCRRGNGEDKGRWRETFCGRMFETRASILHFHFLLNPLQKAAHLLVARRLDQSLLLLRELLGQVLKSHILVDCHHGWADGMRVEFAQQSLEGGIELAIAVVGRMRNTGDLPKLLHALLQSGQC